MTYHESKNKECTLTNGYPGHIWAFKHGIRCTNALSPRRTNRYFSYDGPNQLTVFEKTSPRKRTYTLALYYYSTSRCAKQLLFT